jgi:hypothetical protein
LRWRADAPQPAIVRFVLLSMLLHATIVILFGTSHGGGAGRGEGMLDVLDVTFRRQPSPPEVGLRSGSGAETATGRDLLQRAEPPTAVAPTRREPIPVVEPAKTGEPATAKPAPAALQPDQASPEALPPMPPPAAEPLPRIDLHAPQEVDRPLLPPLIAPPAIERLAPPPKPSDLAAPPDIAPRAIPLVPAAPIERLTAPAVPPELAPPIEVAPLPVPVPPTAPVPAAAPIERLAAPPTPKSLAPPVEVPPREAAIVPAPIERVIVPRIDRELAPAPSLAVPSPLVPPVTPSETAPAQVERIAPPASARPAPAASEAAVPAPNARTAPEAGSAPATAAKPPRLRLGPSPDEDIFKPRRDVAPAGEGGAPGLDMEAARQRAREIASETTSTRGILAALPPPPERQSKEGHALEKAIKPDCRTAYAGMGLLAVPVLVASTIGDAGCRW